ncbi:hypothetical protein BJF83_19970 [Nocardiopsis sp. CNR-923]|uniref:hypothetical protein n=1 Tax=Nocardiopsis sp. CNR-923 TaxID=1904965 RepID=UPI00095A663F|nr:hypothetical protein [Nocardiopsis sp. CNR-923]OLT26885.1 hypothetical protein BJF83_19970 [Nocardiopsis sp. CNR-923]
MSPEKWFPLVPRPRPPGEKLTIRIERITAAARTARSGAPEEAVAAAAQVYNGAALIASDVGLPDLARDWCWEHAQLYQDHLPLDATMAQRALEPVVNLARLQIRAGEGAAAFRMLTTLREGVGSATPTVVDGHELPLDRLTASDEGRAELYRWVWMICLGDGTRALASQGQWSRAAEHARDHNGVGDRLFDGRQVAVIAELTAGDPKTALALAEDSAVREPWERAVQSALVLWCRIKAGEVEADEAATVLQQVQDIQDRHVVFRTRLGIAATDLAGGLHGNATVLAAQLVSAVVQARDVYAARDLLRAWEGELSQGSRAALGSVLDTSGLDTGMLQDASLQALKASLHEARERLSDNLLMT